MLLHRRSFLKDLADRLVPMVIHTDTLLSWKINLAGKSVLVRKKKTELLLVLGFCYHESVLLHSGLNAKIRSQRPYPALFLRRRICKDHHLVGMLLVRFLVGQKYVHAHGCEDRDNGWFFYPFFVGEQIAPTMEASQLAHFVGPFSTLSLC